MKQKKSSFPLIPLCVFALIIAWQFFGFVVVDFFRRHYEVPPPPPQQRELLAAGAIDPYLRDDIFVEIYGDTIPNSRSYVVSGVGESRNDYGGIFWFLLHGEPMALYALISTGSAVDEIMPQNLTAAEERNIDEKLRAFWTKWFIEICGTEVAYDMLWRRNMHPKTVSSTSPMMEKALEHNVPAAWYRLGTLILSKSSSLPVYYKDKKQGPKDAMKALEKAVELGYRDDAAGTIVRAYFYGHAPVKKDMRKALEYAKKGLAIGDPYAVQALGALYYRGEVVPKDLAESAYYLVLEAMLVRNDDMFSASQSLDPFSEAEQQVIIARSRATYNEIKARIDAQEKAKEFLMKERLAQNLPEIRRELDAEFPWFKKILIPYSVRMKAQNATQQN